MREFLRERNVRLWREGRFFSKNGGVQQKELNASECIVSFGQGDFQGSELLFCRGKGVVKAAVSVGIRGVRGRKLVFYAVYGNDDRAARMIFYLKIQKQKLILQGLLKGQRQPGVFGGCDLKAVLAPGIGSL